MFLLINVRNYQGLLLGIINLPWSLCVVVLPGVGLSVIKRTCIFCTLGSVSFLRSSFIMHADDQIVNSPYSIACPFGPFSNKQLKALEECQGRAQIREFVKFSDVFPILLCHIQGYAKRTQTADTMSAVLNQISEEERDKQVVCRTHVNHWEKSTQVCIVI